MVSIGNRYDLRVVPDLYGMSEKDAVNALREQGLTVGAIYPLSHAAPRGTVIVQSPVAGTPITSSTVTVDLYVSS